MSSEISYTGMIQIEPPAPWVEISRSRWVGPHYLTGVSAALHLIEVEIQTPEGTLVKKTADGIVACDQFARDLVPHVQAIVDDLGAGYTYTGYIEGLDRDYMGQWRVGVRDGRAYQVEPEIRWPDEP